MAWRNRRSFNEENMYVLSIVLTVVLLIVAAIDYVRRAWIQETRPVPATWILMMVMMGLAFWMYWENPHKTWTGNIGVTTGVVDIAIILIGVIAASIRHRTFRIAFDRVQWCCLAGGGVIVLCWVFSRDPLLSYILVQMLALVAYTATVWRLWHAKGTTEPIAFWIMMFVGNVSAVYPAWVRKDLYSWIYLGRAIPSTLVFLFLIRRAQRRMNKGDTTYAR